jgi:DNA-binding transcriptional LysR family regulator
MQGYCQRPVHFLAFSGRIDGVDQLAAMTTFMRVVETGSLSGAARSIPTSLTSVSRQIAALEAHYATPLIIRTTRSLSLTDDGRLLYERAKAVLAEMKDIETSLSSKRREPSGRLRVSAPTLMGRLLIAPLLPEFLRRHPAISLDLMLLDRAVDMIEEDIHLAVRVGRLPDSQLIARKLGEITMIVCASPDYLRRRGVPQVPLELSKHDCLLFSDTPGSAEWRFAVEGRSKCKVRLSGSLWINSLDALVSAAQDGAGIVRVPSWQVAQDLAEGRLQQVLTGYAPPPTPLHLLFPPSRVGSLKTRLFGDYLVEQWKNGDPCATRALKQGPDPTKNEPFSKF